MLTNIIKLLDGKNISIKEVVFKTCGHKNFLHLSLEMLSVEYLLVCENVSALKIDATCFPLNIDIAIIDNKQSGWDKSVRYHIYDYENNNINFYCSDIHFLKH